MPQQTNLDVSPYFDDFDPAKDYYRVLFKPGYPVQARELTGLQSILQNQIEKFGQHFFKEGTKVIPGNTSYNKNYNCVQLTNTFQGIPVAAYAGQLVGTKITGVTSGVTAVVNQILQAEDSENGNLTLYVNFISSSTANNSTPTFADSENLVCDTTLTTGLLSNNSIPIGTPFGSTIASGANAVGSAFHVEDGVYFVRGQFINVSTETLILDQYTNNPTYRIGFNVLEEIINSDLDETLTDNSQGYNNYAAPGADRLKISLSLFKKELTNINDDSFVELATVNDGILKSKKNTTEYSHLAAELARRTYDESGDYYVTPFDVTVLNSLNNNIGNRGVFQEGQFTPMGGTPSKDLALYRIGPGKAFVKGYEIETISSSLLDVDKPRTTQTIENQSIIYNTGPTLRLNNVYGTPTIGIGNTYILTLRDERVGVDQTGVPGKQIGVARVYDIALESGSYDATFGQLNQWDMSLYDVQTVTDLTVNEAVTLAHPCFIKGANSGATAFLMHSVSAGTALTAYEVEGEFITNESLIFNGIQNPRVAIAVTAYNLGDVKSVYGTNSGVIGINTFSADIIQSTAVAVGVATITAGSGANYISTITSPNLDVFPGTLRLNDLVEFSDGSLPSNDPIYGKIVGTSSTQVTVTGVATVSQIVSGLLPSSQIDVSNLKILTTPLQSSSDNSLYTPLPKQDISDVDLTSASISIRKTFTGLNITSGELSGTFEAGRNEKFLAYDEERYAVIRSDGSTEALTSDKLVFNATMTTLQIIGLGANDSINRTTLVATLTKSKVTAKQKIRNRVNNLIVNKSKNEGSGIGSTTFNDGLTYGTYPYGTRVQDEMISLNTPDIVQVYGIFESADTNAASAPTIDFASLSSASGTTTELIIGEQLVGQTSGGIAVLAENLSTSQISFVYQNDNLFKEGETVIFQETSIQGVISTIDASSFDITSNYKFTNGQENTFYDFGRLIRKTDSDSPAKGLKIYFENAYYDSTDEGDITTVNSYSTFDYGNIPSVDDVPNSNIIDIRPRVSDYAVTEGSRSPLEFYGRTFNGSGNSAANMLASDESITIDYSNYLGRIDRIFVTKTGDLQVVQGDPAENPQKPIPVDDALEIGVVNLPPYLYRVEDASIDFLEYQRYQMKDIAKLETRIKNLEYYTALSLLETNTSNFFVADADGLNRFKSGFFVDNFETFLTQDTSFGVKNSIHGSYKQLRASHYTTAVDLMFGPVVNTDPDADLDFTAVEGVNVRKSNDIITLDYSEVEWLKQEYGTRWEAVTPFIVAYWNGTLALTPSSDNWMDTVKLNPKVINREGNFNEVVANLAATTGFDPQGGFAQNIWNSWETIWTGTEQRSGGTRTENFRRRGNDWEEGWQRTQQFRATIERSRLRRTGQRVLVTETFDRQTTGERVIDRGLVPFMRSRNLEFVAKGMKPLTRTYGFFDNEEVSKYCVPKLIEMVMSSGTFTVGEKVTGVIQNTGLGSNNRNTNANITFRVAQLNHKEGPYDSPTSTYPENPYTNQPLSATYSSTSTLINVDTFSLQAQVQGDYSGWVATDMVLTGESSGAQATISDVKLVTDINGTLIGSFWIPNPNILNFPRFECGVKTLKFTSDTANEMQSTTAAGQNYIARGTTQTIQETIVSTRNAEFTTQQIDDETTTERTISGGWITTGEVLQWRNTWNNDDPLAQTFTVDDETGVFVTKADVFFRTKDDMDIPVNFSIRTVENGFPTKTIIPLTDVSLNPNDISVSSTGDVATTFSFNAPVYLEPTVEYAMVLLSGSAKYSVYISRVGETDLVTESYVANQPTIGSLFKSQNASTWEPSQWEDLKYTLYRADFIENGTLEFYNPELTKGNDQIAQLQPNSVVLTSKEVRVGLGSTLADSGYQLGNTFYQLNTNATGSLAGVAGTAQGTLNIINAGIGYTPLSGNYQFTGVVLDTVTGNGRGATANIDVTDGVAVGATISGVGTGYQVGDVLGVTTVGLTSLGRNMRLSVSGIGNTNELILTNVQGDFTVGTSNTMMYYNSSGISTILNSGFPAGTGGDIQVSSVNTATGKDGLHIKVNHRNHGMYFSKNKVTLSDIESDVKPTKLNVAYNVGDVGGIQVATGTTFSTFENVAVGSTNYGYLQIGSEVISYDTVSGNTIGVSTRGIDNTIKKSYPVGTPVYKYELGGISLRRINRTHSLLDTSIADPITFDSYNIKLDTSATTGTGRSTDIGFPQLFIDDTKSAGGYNVRATQNIPFEIISPMVANVTVPKTGLTAEVKTTTATSISGNEIPWVEHDFENIVLNQTNYLDTPRVIGSKVNADQYLSNVKGSKSLNMRLFLNTTDTRVSPVVDGQRSNIILTSNRVNSIIDNYATDNRANTVDVDPTAFQYISKEMILENSASSIKILVAAHIHLDSDIRAFYAINNKEGIDPIFTPFPGYTNLNNRGQVIDAENNDGRSDKFVPKTNSYGFGEEVEFSDYVFTADNLPSFRSYRIKLIMTSTTQTYVPRAKDLRVIALA